MVQFGYHHPFLIGRVKSVLLSVTTIAVQRTVGEGESSGGVPFKKNKKAVDFGIYFSFSPFLLFIVTLVGWGLRSPSFPVLG